MNGIYYRVYYRYIWSIIYSMLVYNILNVKMSGELVMFLCYIMLYISDSSGISNSVS